MLRGRLCGNISGRGRGWTKIGGRMGKRSRKTGRGRRDSRGFGKRNVKVGDGFFTPRDGASHDGTASHARSMFDAGFFLVVGFGL